MPKRDIEMSSSDLDPSQPRSAHIGFLLLDGFAMMSYASIAEPFRAANVLSGQSLYRWTHLASAGSCARASSGAELRTEKLLGDTIDLDLLFVFAGGNPSLLDDPALLAWLRHLAARGVRLGGVSGGPYLLARAGLLDGYRCTIHWEHRPGFTEAFPRARVVRGLYVIDRDRLTCAGGTAGLDLSIALIARDHGQALAAEVSDWYIRTQAREAAAEQRLALHDRYGVHNDKVAGALAMMEAQLEEPVSRKALAAAAGVSVRQLERLFAATTGNSIAAEYRRLRLERAGAMLKETSLSVTEVAVACGFVSQPHFSRLVRQHFGCSPLRLRRARAFAGSPAGTQQTPGI